jgi:hypothetical protein
VGKDRPNPPIAPTVKKLRRLSAFPGQQLMAGPPIKVPYLRVLFMPGLKHDQYRTPQNGI